LAPVGISWHQLAPVGTSFFQGKMILSSIALHTSHMDLIDSEHTKRLGLEQRKLDRPERIELAMQPGEDRKGIELSHYVKLHLHDPSGAWTPCSICTFVAPNLCSPVVLGLPFLSRNKIVIDHDERTAINKLGDFDLLNPKTPDAPKARKRTLKETFHHVRGA
jgi:hypothetical protein